MIPPDPGTEVIVSFRDGNIKMPVIMGCTINNQYNYSVPGYPGGVSYGDPAINAPVTEKNLNADPGKHGANVPRPMHADIAEQITQQGLINDSIRGAGSSGGRRESPSKVFGILTPGDWDPQEGQEGEGKVRLAGHQLIMDDKYGSRMIRLRSGGGNQLLMHDDTGTIYITNSKGEVWMEMDQTGSLNVYAKRGINFRTGGDFNVRADGTINLEGGGDVNIKAAGDMRASQYVGGAIQEALGAFGLPTLGNGGRVNITAKQSLQLYADQNARFTAGGGDIDISTGNSLNLTGNGLNLINGKSVNINAPNPAGMGIHLYSTTFIDMQALSVVSIDAPAVDITGGLISLNSTPPFPIPPAPALPAFKLPGKPLADVDDALVPFSRAAAKQGASAFPTQGKRDGLAPQIYSIVTKLITAEPWVGHAQSDPIKKASDPAFNQSISDNLPPGGGSVENPAPGDVVVTDKEGNTTVKKGVGYVDEAGNQLESAQDQLQDAYDEVKGEFDQATAGIKGEIDAVKADLKEQFPEYEVYQDVYNNVSALFDSDLTGIQRIELLVGMLGSIIPPIRFPTSNQLQEEIVGINSKLTELEAKLAEYGIDADQLMADLLTGNIAGLKAQAMGVFNDAVSEGLNNSELAAKMKENGLDISGLDPEDPMFPSIAVTDKDGNTFVDFSKGMSDPASALLGAAKLNTQFNEVAKEFPTVTSLMGENQQSGVTSFIDGIGGPEKFLDSNVGEQLRKADKLFAEAGVGDGGGTGGRASLPAATSTSQRTPEQSLELANGVMANIPRLMKGWVLASERPGGPMVFNQNLSNQRDVEIELFTSTDDMNLKAVLNESVIGGETWGTMLQKIRAQKQLYFESKTPAGRDTEFGKAVKATV
jgi:hypothetical protein